MDNQWDVTWVSGESPLIRCVAYITAQMLIYLRHRQSVVNKRRVSQ